MEFLENCQNQYTVNNYFIILIQQLNFKLFSNMKSFGNNINHYEQRLIKLYILFY